MQINDMIQLNNNDTVKIIDILQHYGTKSCDYLIQNVNSQRYIITHDELLELMKKRRTTMEKIDLYKEYFSGRPDVYAQKWSNGKGYSPALKNWFAFYKTRENKELQSKLVKHYLPYTVKTVHEQIMMDDAYHRYGIYPLLTDNCTNLLVFDFDQHKKTDPDPKAASKALIATCLKYGLDCLPEISQSGKGYHIWLFFRHVPAKEARRLGTLLLLETLNSLSITLESFDRMIPNQDCLSSEGFGNLIALPLKWSDVKENRSVFTDNLLKPLEPDELFDRLAMTHRYSKIEVEEFLRKISQDLGLMVDEGLLGSLKQINKFPKKIRGYISGDIWIERKNLTHAEQLTLLGLATFSNPEYVKKQRMRMPVWNIPSVITVASLDSKYLRLPRGCLDELLKKCSCEFEEKFSSVSKINVKFNGELRKEQQQALKKLYKENMSMLCGHTGFGKTVVGLALVAQRCIRTVIIVPTTSIGKQWQQQALKFLNIDESPYKELTPKGRLVKKQKIEIISGSRDHPSRLVDIITIQKLSRMSEAEQKDFFGYYNQVIVDECHHIAATTFEKVLANANCKYIVGLTATPERKDGLQMIMHLRLGKIVYQDKDRVEDNILLHRYLYPRYIGVGKIDYSSNTYNQKIQNLVTDYDRNQLIVTDLTKCFKEKRHILLLSERVSHLKILKNMLKQVIPEQHIFLVTGALGNMKDIDLKKPGVILSTTKYVGEGFDLPILDTLFVTLPFSWKGNTQQYLGRLERAIDQKDELWIYDYVDIADDMFAKMFKKRLSIYRKAGYEIAINSSADKYQSQYYDYDNYLPQWEEDLQKSKDIYLRKKYISPKLISRLKELSLECKITIEVPIVVAVTLKEKMKNITIKSAKHVGSNMCIFDHHICWYGDLDFGGIVKPYMTAIRIDSHRLARDAR